MKKIGLIGGISWFSTIDYYRLMNQKINARLGGVSSAEIILYSVDFAIIKKWTEAGEWDRISEHMSSIAKKLEAAGADCLMLGANTMHKIAGEVQAAINIPLINIAEAVADRINAKGLTKVALLGTKYTMQLDFYKDKLAEKNIETIIPNEVDIEMINSCIYNEMGKGIFLPERKQQFLAVIDQLKALGAEGVILGCTEIPLLIKQEDTPLPVFDSTEIHVNAAVNFALAQ